MKKPTVDERRKEILETTCEVVIERGFAGTRIADVAKRLDVSSSLIHYHFDSKEQLLAEAFDYYASKDLAELEAEIENAPTALGKLDRVIQNYVPEGSDDVEWMLWIDGWGEALRNPMMRKISQELDEQSVDLLARIIRDGVESGEFTCPDPHACGNAAHGVGRRPRGAVRRSRRDDESRSVDRPCSLFAAARRSVSIVCRLHRRQRHAEVLAPPSPADRCRSAPSRHQLLRPRQPSRCHHAGARMGRRCDLDLGNGKTVTGREQIAAAFDETLADLDWVVQSRSADGVRGRRGERQRASGRVTVQERVKKRKVDKAITDAGTYHDRTCAAPGRGSSPTRRSESSSAC